jgi:L-alanine-DL-glutamate epimerase-like enolase superfamily enzyme
MPSFGVGTDPQKIKAAADQGYFIMKLKTAPPAHKEMIEKISHFFRLFIKPLDITKPYIPGMEKYLIILMPMNGMTKRYAFRFLDHARKIGAFDQIAAVEEPFGERNEMFVGDMGVTIAADESAHTVEDAAKRIEQGYGAIAVKAIAKTLSMTMKITQLAHEKNICFVRTLLSILSW